ncbi:MAG: glycosyltransferase [Hyphomicrobiaceae bacterium]
MNDGLDVQQTPPHDLAAVTRLLVGYNSAAALREFAATAPDDLKTLVVDNASRDDTLGVARALGYRTLPLPANYGYGGAIMRGLKAIETELVLIANPDVRVGRPAVLTLLDAARRYAEADVFVPAIRKPDGAAFFRFESRFEPRATRREIPSGDACIRTLSGAAMLVRRRQFLEHGFDPRIFLYFEDDDIGIAYGRQQRAIVYIPDAVVQHGGDASSARSRATEDLKALSFGWSWGYVMRKHDLGDVATARRSAMLKLVGALMTLRFERARRQRLVIEGLDRFASGAPAPYLPPDAGDASP